MFYGSVVLAAALFVTVKPVEACTILMVHERRPNGDLARITGTVTGYATGIGVAGEVRRPNGLLVRVAEVLSGGPVNAFAQIYPITFGADCSNQPYLREQLEQQFPLGSQIVVQGVTVHWPEAAGTSIIAAVSKGRGFVRPVPAGVPRTPEGDLNFEQAATLKDRQFTRFEFDRVILTLSTSSPRERGSRLRNLAHYRGFRDVPDARGLYLDLLAESGLSKAQQIQLLELFDTLRARRS